MYQCLSCNAAYPDDVRKQWGKTVQSTGLGPRPVCSKLVPDDTVGKPPHPLQLCRGELVFVAGAPIGDNAVAITPILPEKVL